MGEVIGDTVRPSLFLIFECMSRGLTASPRPLSGPTPKNHSHFQLLLYLTLYTLLDCLGSWSFRGNKNNQPEVWNYFYLVVRLLKADGKKILRRPALVFVCRHEP